ncbi:unnamed protein product, partial [Symbiodinium necroappetens]
MGKRAQQTQASTQQAKAPKIVDPMEKELTPVLEQLDKARGIISASTVEMLQAVVPHCISSAKGDRHEYQNSMLESVETTLKQIQAKQQAELANAQSALADFEAKQENAASQLQMVEGQVAQCQEDKATKDQTETDSNAAVAEAAQALQLAQESEQSLGAEKDAILKDQEESQKFLTTTWEAVKTGAFAGQEWRERNKAIEASVKILDGFGLDASLKAALPTALKTKPGDRKRFSLCAVQFAEVAITTRLQKLREKVDNFEQEAIARSQAVTTAKEALASCEEKLRVAKAEAVSAKDALQAAVHSKAEIEKEIKQSLLDGSSSMRFTLSLLAALTSGSDVTWSHELYDVEFIDLNQTLLTSVPKSQHEALIKILHVPDTHFSRESDASPWSDRMHRAFAAPQRFDTRVRTSTGFELKQALRFAESIPVDVVAIGGDLINFPSQSSVDDLYKELN